MSFTFPLSSPFRMAACTAAPNATASSGLILLQSSLPAKEVAEERLNFWNACAATDQYDLVHGALVHATVPQHFLDRLESAAEKVLAQLLEPGSGDAAVKVFTLKQRIDFNIGVVC